jgi:hypothetical protein
MPTDVYLHSEIKEIMITKPSFALKWGTVLLMGLLALLLAFAAWATYPEFITLDITLSAPEAMYPVVAAQPNARAVLLVHDGDQVQPGTPLLAWQDAEQTSYPEAQRLAALLRPGATASGSLPRALAGLRPGQLGQLRPVYYALYQAASTGVALPGVLATGRQQVQQWLRQQVVLAPRAGVVQLTAPGRPQVVAASGQPVLYVLPPRAAYLAVGSISREQYAVVRPGQQVLAQVHELGAASLPGRVVGVAPLAQRGTHQVVIRLAPAAQRLNPTFAGSAKIMLRRQSLLSKLFTVKS